MKTTSLTVLACTALGGARAVSLAGCHSFGPDPDIRHFVPVDKGLGPEYFAMLRRKGATHIYRDEALKTIGMPIGGIAAGQLYLRGDGTLGCWQIFNQHINTGYGATNYQYRTPGSTKRQGFEIRLLRPDTPDPEYIRLDGQSNWDVEFVGEYPIGRVTYRNDERPIGITMEAFSPFIPLNSNDSTLPATVFRFTIENTSDDRVGVGLVAWLENAVLCHSEDQVHAHRRHRIFETPQGMRAVLSAEELPPAERDKRRPVRPLHDFEGPDYNDWTVEGEAFGTGPAGGTLPNQQHVSGFAGKGLVNTFIDGDRPHGILTSPSFTIDRRHINFLIGGGNHPNETCINLFIDSQIVRTATGKNNELLLWHSWDVSNLEGREARIEIVDEHSGGWGHINIDQIDLADAPRFGRGGPLNTLEDWGTMTLTILGPTASEDDRREAASRIHEPLSAEIDQVYPLPNRLCPVVRSSDQWLEPGETREVTAVLTWHFPNHGEHGRQYAARFEDAEDVARYVATNIVRLTNETKLWHDTYYDSTLPHWLLDRLHMPIANLATGTCQYWANGRFWAWEGVGCCSGTCTHVWNYAHGLARLFPDLERSIRELQDFGTAQHDDGLVAFRGVANGWYAADGQAGTILKAYRDHLLSSDDSFLKRQWPNIRRAIDFLLRQDDNDDGLIENSQHNTYDINFEGPNTMVGSLYLAALRAGDEMARCVNMNEYADRLRHIFETGRRRSVERLFNGEYFIQIVDLDQHPRFQYGEGCLSDQLFGQGWAHQLDLGHIYPADTVHSALQSIWKYNWTPDVQAQNEAHKPERWFVSPGEAGLFTCTWPKSAFLDQGVRYRNEVWTGIEYQVAGHMVWEGMVDEALAIVRGVHDRYDGVKHNPWNEVECGNHYARTLASWGVFTALAGFEYDGPARHIGFHPRFDSNSFRSAFTASEGWGTLDQQRNQDVTRQENAIVLRYGSLLLDSIALTVPASWNGVNLSANLNDHSLPEPLVQDHDLGRLVIRFRHQLSLSAGDALTLSLERTT